MIVVIVFNHCISNHGDSSCETFGKTRCIPVEVRNQSQDYRFEKPPISLGTQKTQPYDSLEQEHPGPPNKSSHRCFLWHITVVAYKNMVTSGLANK